MRSQVVKDMEARLKKTRARKQLDKIDRTTAIVKAAMIDVALPEDGTFYDRLHDKIMAACFEEVDMSWMPIFAGTLFNPIHPLNPSRKF